MDSFKYKFFRKYKMLKLVIKLISIINICQAEYYIKHDAKVSYLEKKFTNLSETIFPYDIRISMSLSRLIGTLLYSIDSNGNQLKVNLNDVSKPGLDIELNKLTYYVGLSPLCGCRLCQYENMTLTMQIRDAMYFQCNGRFPLRINYTRSRKYNIEYPIPQFNKTDKLEAYLWLVNTPKYEELVPDIDQLAGCIFDVWYNNKLLIMDSTGVNSKCIKSCTPGICHSGECLETYDSNIICNCTTSFKNGKFCNDIIESQNFEIKQQFQFNMVKLSFTSKSENLFQMNNAYLSVNLLVKGRELILLINNRKQSRISSEYVITDKYEATAQNIVIMVFQNSFIEIKFYGNSCSWIFIRFPYFIDLSRELFERLVLKSKKGKIDFVHKFDPTKIEWNNLQDNKDKIDLIKENTTSAKGIGLDENMNYGTQDYGILINKVNASLGIISICFIFIIIFLIIVIVASLLLKGIFERFIRLSTATPPTLVAGEGENLINKDSTF